MAEKNKKEPIKLKTEWQNTQVELQKVLHGYELADVDKKEGKVDYIAEEQGEKMLLRVLVDKNLSEYKADLESVKETLEDLEESDINKAIIMAKRFTSSARRLAKEEKALDYASSKYLPIYSPVDLLFAIQKQLQEYCKLKCGKIPTSEEECQGYQNGEFTCLARKVSDDADFHAEQRWIELLLDDFSKLVKLTRQLKEEKIQED